MLKTLLFSASGTSESARKAAFSKAAIPTFFPWREIAGEYRRSRLPLLEALLSPDEKDTTSSASLSFLAGELVEKLESLLRGLGRGPNAKIFQ